MIPRFNIKTLTVIEIKGRCENYKRYCIQRYFLTEIYRLSRFGSQFNYTELVIA